MHQFTVEGVILNTPEPSPLYSTSYSTHLGMVVYVDCVDNHVEQMWSHVVK